MPPISTFTQAHEALRQFYRKETTYTLGRMRALMDFLGNPQDSLRIIHVAGTSGKTSTAYYASALLEQSGASVGLTVSPHVDEVNERVQLNHTPLPEAEFCRELSEFLGLVAASSVRPSYFEVMVAFAYWEFARKNVDYAVVEVGLGGLLDGTNVISRPDKVCIITDIGLDHTEILGDTLELIATQKAGIIRPGNHVFMHQQSPGVQDVVKGQCVLQGARLHLRRGNNQAPAFLPLFQQRNFSLAEYAVRYVLKRDGLPELSTETRRQAAHVYIPARMEQINLGNNKTLIVDGAHNAQKLATLVKAVQEAFPGQPVTALVAFVSGSNDSRWQGGVSEIMRLTDSLIVTSFAAEQDVPKSSVDPEVVAQFCREHSVEPVVVATPAKAFQQLQRRPEPVLLVAGSFYLLNHIRPLL